MSRAYLASLDITANEWVEMIRPDPLWHYNKEIEAAERLNLVVTKFVISYDVRADCYNIDTIIDFKSEHERTLFALRNL